MAAEEIVSGVYGIGMAMGYVNAFLIVDEGGLALVDSGLAKRKDTILSAVAGAGKQPADLKHILITHHHIDHIGSLADLKEATAASCYAHPADSPIVRGDQPQPGPNPASLMGKLAGPVLERLSTPAPPVAVDVEVADGEELPIAGGIKAVHTPGHTPGHLSFLLPRHGGVLFVGDAAANLLRLGLPLGMFTADRQQAKESIRKLAALEFDIACFGHGRVLKGEANLRFRRLAEKLAR
ncbi:MAG: MBL fold metallo-hydrolase [Chloroflexi bacterium]|nr:MBL fold metallo-hydrolase [Chloroflexota bacterium]